VYYQATITTPANTSASVPQKTMLPLARGVISKILVGFPPGPAGLCHVQIRDKGWQIAPWSLAEDMAWDNFVYEMTPQYALVAEPYEVMILTWNEDDSYDHQVFIGIEMAEGEPGLGGLLLQYPLQGS